jgi:hypothetical protein
MNQHIVVGISLLFLSALALVACGDDSGAGFSNLPGGDAVSADSGESDAGADALADAGGGDTGTEDAVDASDTGETDADDADSPDADAQADPDGDAAALPDGDSAVSPPDASDASDTAPDATPDIMEDADAALEDTLGPYDCEEDDECLVLVPKQCCPGLADPCSPVPAVGTLALQIENLGWIEVNCDPEVPCPDPTPAECTECFDLISFVPACNLADNACELDTTIDCDALCAAAAKPLGQPCPKVSDLSLLTPANIASCGCP